jgi:hypothetical protein
MQVCRNVLQKVLESSWNGHAHAAGPNLHTCPSHDGFAGTCLCLVLHCNAQQVDVPAFNPLPLTPTLSSGLNHSGSFLTTYNVSNPLETLPLLLTLPVNIYGLVDISTGTVADTAADVNSLALLHGDMHVPAELESASLNDEDLSMVSHFKLAIIEFAICSTHV